MSNPDTSGAATDLATRRGYHHGNLREALLEAARRLTAERGPHGFTLAEAARLAGVSASAPYRHFRDKEALLAELCQRGFRRFGARLREAVAAGATPQEGLAAMGSAYLAFAREEPGYYGAMFSWRAGPVIRQAPAPNGPAAPAAPPGDPARVTADPSGPPVSPAACPDGPPPEDDPSGSPVSPAACPDGPPPEDDPFDTLVGAIAGLLPPGRQREAARLLALEVWAISHGIAGLERAGLPGPGAGAPAPEAVLADAVQRLIHAARPDAPRMDR